MTLYKIKKTLVVRSGKIQLQPDALLNMDKDLLQWANINKSRVLAINTPDRFTQQIGALENCRCFCPRPLFLPGV